MPSSPTLRRAGRQVGTGLAETLRRTRAHTRGARCELRRQDSYSRSALDVPVACQPRSTAPPQPSERIGSFDVDPEEALARTCLGDLGELHARQPGQHITAEPFRVVHSPRVRLLPFCERRHREDITGRGAGVGRRGRGLSGRGEMARFSRARRLDGDHGRPCGLGALSS